MAQLKAGTTIGGKLAETVEGAQAKADEAEARAKAYTDQEVAEVNQALAAHKANTANPHNVTKSQVGLGNVENYMIATQAEAEEGIVSNKYMTPQRTKQAIDLLQAVKSVAGKTGDVTLSKSDVGLSNVDNIKQASKTEFDAHNNDTTQHITSAERTAWNNKSNLILGETSSTAYRGDRGKIAYDHSQSAHAPEDIIETNIINHNTPFVKNNTIHSLKLYNRALTDEEILQNYQAGQCSPLLVMRGEVIG